MAKLNIGCGGNLKQGYINIDKYPTKPDVQKADACATGFDGNCVEEIFVSHLIEHLEPDHFDRALHHWHHILIFGGRLIVLCPNARIYIAEWLLAAEIGDLKSLDGWARRNALGWEGKGEGMWNRNLFTVELLQAKVSAVGFQIHLCEETETRVKDQNHFEYREKGDIRMEAIKA